MNRDKMIVKMLKTFLYAGIFGIIGVIVVSFTVSGNAFSKPPLTDRPAVQTKAEQHLIELLFEQDGCKIYAFHSEGTRHLLVTGKNVFCAMK